MKLGALLRKMGDLSLVAISIAFCLDNGKVGVRIIVNRCANCDVSSLNELRHQEYPTLLNYINFISKVSF